MMMKRRRFAMGKRRRKEKDISPTQERERIRKIRYFGDQTN
jgi:hypothetical protein